MKRRDFIKAGAGFLVALPSMFSNSIFSQEFSKTVNKVISLGFDGLEHSILFKLAKEGRIKYIPKIINSGSFVKMYSTPPPCSPVAWASYATGEDPGVHGIFDFIHRDPKTYIPLFSQSKTTPPSKYLKIGDYRIPLNSGKVTLERKGKPFWEYLEEYEIFSTVFKIPSNYPPSEMKNGNALSGMGTPDLLGTYGVYTLYTTDEEEAIKELSASNINYADFEDNVMEGEIEGPPNPIVNPEEVEEPEPLKVKFKAYWDRLNKSVRIDVQGKTLLLKEGEISPWIELKFEVIPYINSIYGMVRFLPLTLTSNKFRLYISPVSISPKNPALPISSPDDYSKELAEKVGLFHTLGLPADTKALSNETFSVENFITQSETILDESIEIFKIELERFNSLKRGFLFFYFSSIDQGSHMLWSLSDPEHPFYHPGVAKKLGNQIEKLYIRFDEIVGYMLKNIDKSAEIIINSDHGFNPFRRKFNINTFLAKEGYLKVYDNELSGTSILDSCNWSKTKAYAIGLNGLYLNLEGREAQGIVKESEKRKLLYEIKEKLLSYVDEKTGVKPISHVFISEEVFSHNHIKDAPDIIVGFNRHYRIANESALGTLSENIVSDNLDWWAGDHCISPYNVPASLITSFRLRNLSRKVYIWDIAPTILKLFGVKNHSIKRGKSLI